MGGKLRTEADYHALAARRGFIWLGPLPRSTISPTGWQCSKGHTLQTCYNNIARGTNCPDCQRVQPEDYTELAQRHGVTWLGPYPARTTDKTAWRCDLGHIWETAYATLRATARGCPVCSGRQRLSDEDYHTLARSHGLTWLGPLPSNNKGKTGWRCDRGHEWLASYNTVQSGEGCPRCHSKSRKTREDYESLARARGYTWLGPLPARTNKNTGWTCDQGHSWLAPYNNLQQGHGCPECSLERRRARRRMSDSGAASRVLVAKPDRELV